MKLAGGVLNDRSPPVLLPKATASSTSWQGGFRCTVRLKPMRRCRFRLRVSCSMENSDTKTASFQYRAEVVSDSQPGDGLLTSGVRSPFLPANILAASKLSLSDQAFFLVAFIGCTATVAFTSLVVAAVPTLYAMRGAAIALSRLADTAREELPSTMTAIRLSGTEISDLTLELNDLSQEIAEGVSKSAQAVQAAEAGVRQIGSLARQQTMSMIEERANLPIISIQPVVAGAAKKTSRAVGQATKTLWNLISRGEHSSEGGEDDDYKERIES